MSTSSDRNTKISESSAHKGSLGQLLLGKGQHCEMRLWELTPENKIGLGEHSRSYETVGYVIDGHAELFLGDNKLVLSKGDSWVVPIGVKHHYNIIEHFKAVEAVCPLEAASEVEKESMQGRNM